jgi:hypothetical protein
MNSMLKKLLLTAAFPAALGLHANALGQQIQYSLSMPISGVLSMSARDLNGPPDSHYDPNPSGSVGAAGGFSLNFNTLTETVYVDKTAGTVRQAGTISVTPAAPSFVINETQGAVSGATTVFLGPSGGNVFSFDTGMQPYTFNSGIYTFNGNILNLGSFAGSYSLLTGGQTYTGSFNYTLTAFSGLAAYTFTQFTETSPTSISLSGLGDVNFGVPGGVRYGSIPSVAADVTAANGFHLGLSTGAGAGFGVFGEYINWSSGPVTANVVPEPSSFALLGIGLAGWMLRRQRKI